LATVDWNGHEGEGLSGQILESAWAFSGVTVMQINIEIDSRKKSALPNGFCSHRSHNTRALASVKDYFFPMRSFIAIVGRGKALLMTFCLLQQSAIQSNLLVPRKTALDNWTRDITVEISCP